MRQSTPLRLDTTRTAKKNPQRRARSAPAPGYPLQRVWRPGGAMSNGRGAPAAGRMLWRRRMFFMALAGVLLCALFLPLQVRIWRLQSQLNQLQNEKQALLQEQQQIQQQIGYYSSDAYVEEAARQELGLVKPGEALVLPAVPGKVKPPPNHYHTNVPGPIGD